MPYIHYFNEYWNCHRRPEHQIQPIKRNALCPLQPKHCITISSSLNFLYLWQIFTADNPNCAPYAPTFSIILLQIIFRWSRFNGVPGHVDDCKRIYKVSAERRIYVVHSELAKALPNVCPLCYITHDNMLPVMGIFTCRTQYNMMLSTHCHFQITSSVRNKYGGDTQHTVWQTLRDQNPRYCMWCSRWPTPQHCMWCSRWLTPRQWTWWSGGVNPPECEGMQDIRIKYTRLVGTWTVFNIRIKEKWHQNTTSNGYLVKIYVEFVWNSHGWITEDWCGNKQWQISEKWWKVFRNTQWWSVGWGNGVWFQLHKMFQIRTGFAGLFSNREFSNSEVQRHF